MLRFFFKFLVGTIGLFLVFFIGMYYSTNGDFIVPETVDSNPAIPHDTIGRGMIHLQTFGNPKNPLLVVLHGGPGFDHKYLLPLAALKDSFFVLFYDQAGCGLSTRYNDPDLNFQAALEDLDAIIQKYNHHARVSLIGHSYGALLGVKALERLDTIIDKAILMEPEFLTSETFDKFFEKTNYMRPAFNLTMLSFMVKHWFESLHIEEPDKHASHDYFYGLYARAFAMDGHPMHMALCKEKDSPIMFNRYGAVASAALLRSLFTADGSLGIHFITPGITSRGRDILFLGGGCNRISGFEVQKKHAEAIPGSSVTEIKNAGFNPLFSQPEQVISVIRQFLD